MHNVIFDAHCDTVELGLDEGNNISNPKYSFNLDDVKLNLPYIQCMASFVHTKYADDSDGAYLRVNQIIDKFYEEYKRDNKNIKLIASKGDITEVLENKKLGIILTIENGICIENNIENITNLYNRGVRMMSLTWNDNNKIACGTNTLNDTGLTKKGIECVKYMNETNMLIDVSHLSIKSFYDVINTTNKPIVASHSCSYSICNNKRNLGDEQIINIAKSKGVIGICYHKDFLSGSGMANIEDVVNHIEYISDLAGVDYVGLGSDFDGIEQKDLPYDLKSVNDVIKIKKEMVKRGFSNNEISKIMGNNFINIFKQIL